MAKYASYSISDTLFIRLTVILNTIALYSIIVVRVIKLRSGFFSVRSITKFTTRDFIHLVNLNAHGNRVRFRLMSEGNLNRHGCVCRSEWLSRYNW